MTCFARLSAAGSIAARSASTTNHYFDPRLEPFHGMEVLVGYDIFDASKVWVRKLEEVDGAPGPPVR